MNVQPSTLLHTQIRVHLKRSVNVDIEIYFQGAPTYSWISHRDVLQVQTLLLFLENSTSIPGRFSRYHWTSCISGHLPNHATPSMPQFLRPSTMNQISLSDEMKPNRRREHFLPDIRSNFISEIPFAAPIINIATRVQLAAVMSPCRLAYSDLLLI